MKHITNHKMQNLNSVISIATTKIIIFIKAICQVP